MEIHLQPWTDADHEIVRALAGEAAIAPQFEKLLGPGRLEHWLADPHCDPAMRMLARVDGAPAGFGYAILLAAAEPPWAMLRVAVSGRFRRRGVGARLLEGLIAALPERMPGCREINMSAYEPCPDASRFAERHGFRHVRTYWLMERPAVDLAAPDWPAGIETRGFDGSDRSLGDWNDAYNASFARHHHFVPSTAEECRALAAAPGFDPSSVLLAYDAGRCVAFCRNVVHAGRGEIAALGVVPEWQGRGVGRALLRWGVRWLSEHRALPITLMVDGENVNALRLYRSEGFEIAKARPVWSRAAGIGTG